jgi:hypothetical protein
MIMIIIIIIINTAAATATTSSSHCSFSLLPSMPFTREEWYLKLKFIANLTTYGL